jgi:hypothetical protein
MFSCLEQIINFVKKIYQQFVSNFERSFHTKPVQFEESGKNLLFSVQMCSMKSNEAVFDFGCFKRCSKCSTMVQNW